jgi:hypothetical protein
VQCSISLPILARLALSRSKHQTGRNPCSDKGVNLIDVATGADAKAIAERLQDEGAEP